MNNNSARMGEDNTGSQSISSPTKSTKDPGSSKTMKSQKLTAPGINRTTSQEMGMSNQPSMTSPSKQDHHHHHHHHKHDAPDSAVVKKHLFKKNIVGDLFGTSYGDHSLVGFMYRSRVNEKADSSKSSSQEKKEESLQLDSVVSSKEVQESESDSDQDTQLLKNMNPKQQLALTIKNWSNFPENDEHIIKEGAVYALIALSHMDDSTIRKCCASSFFHLSLREKNREELLSIGTTAGVITLAMQARSWKVAKLCALTLCNLSMQQHGEAIMAKEGAILALVVLLGIKGQSLLPICVQALYNITSAADHFKGIERIMKALLNVTSVGFDHSEFLVKALVNCSRYSWLRLRIIEDGGITNLHGLIPNLVNVENRQEMIFNMLTAIRSLSESAGCRSEMLQKGSVELLYNILMTTHCEDKGKLLIMKILHNFLQSPLALSMNAFELSAMITYQIVMETNFVATIQYCTACFHIVTKEKLRGLKQLANCIIDAMSVVLKSSDAITQFFAISTAGNLFFHDLCEQENKVNQLVTVFIENGSNIIDSAAKQALALALAKLSQEMKYLRVIDQLQLLEKVLRLLIDLREAHRDSLLLQESCCIAICRISLCMNNQSLITQADKNIISQIFLDMLNTNDQFVLLSTVSGIRALGSSGLCPKELLYHHHNGESTNLLPKIATIIARYPNDMEMCRFGCAVLAVFSYNIEAHTLLAERSILNVLFNNINSEDNITREVVANTVCNLSMHSEACHMMITMNVVEVLGQLSSSTSETILDLCSKALCNFTCYPDLHYQMISNHVLEILIMISLVRTVSSQTKCTCAKALLNLITDENVGFMTTSGAVRVFASLSTVPFPPVQHVCAKGFYLLTTNTLRRKEFVKHRAVVQSLFHMIKSSFATASSSVKTRLGVSLINLLSCSASNSEAMSAGGLPCLKIIATMDFEELRDITAKMILKLTLNEKFHPVLMREPIVPMLILVLQKHISMQSFSSAIFALSCLSQVSTFKKIILKDQGLQALIGTIFNGKVNDVILCQEICRIWTHLSYLHDHAEAIIKSGNLAVAMEIIFRAETLLYSRDTFTLMIVMIRNISENISARHYLIEQDIFILLVKILLKDSDTAFHDTVGNSIDSEAGSDDENEEVRAVNSDSSANLAAIAAAATTAQMSMHAPLVRSNTSSHLTEAQSIKTLGYAAMVKIIYNLSLVPALHESLVTQGVMELLQKICLPLTPPQNTNASPESPKLDASFHDTHASSTSTLPLDDSVDSPPSGKLERGVSSKSFFAGESKSLYSNKRRNFSFSMAKVEEDVPYHSHNHSEQKPHSGGTRSLAHAASMSATQMNGGNGSRPSHRLFFTPEEVDLIAQTLKWLSQSPSCHESMVHGEVMAMIRALIYADINDHSKCEIATTLSQLSQSKSCRETLVNQGACELLIALSITSDSNTQAHCGTALAYLSEITKVHKGVVASLLLLSLNLEDVASMSAAMPNQDVMNALMIHSRRTEHGHPSGGTITGVAKEMMQQLKTTHNLSSKDATVNVNANSSTTLSESTPMTPSSKSNASQTLTNLLRDLMNDRKKFDSYLEALQKNNQDSLNSNEFVPKTPKKISQQANANHEYNLNTRSGLRASRSNILEGRQAVVVPTVDLHSTAPFTRLAVSPHHTHLLIAEESALLKSNFDPYLYNAPENTNNEGYKTNFAGLSKKRLSDLPLPGIPPDRDLEPPNRHDELLKIPLNQEPLPKDMRAPVYLDHHRSTTSDINANNDSKLDENRPKSRNASAGVNHSSSIGLNDDSLMSGSLEANLSSSVQSNSTSNSKRKLSKLLKQKYPDVPVTPANNVSSKTNNSSNSGSTNERNASPVRQSATRLSIKSTNSVGSGGSGPPPFPESIGRPGAKVLPKLTAGNIASRKTSKNYAPTGSSESSLSEGLDYEEDDFEQPSFMSK